MRRRIPGRWRVGARAGLVALLVAVLLAVGLADAAADTFSSPAGRHVVQGAILADYRAVGGPTGPLGYPTTDELATPNRLGRFNLFQRGGIYWTPGTGAHAIVGAIWTTYGRLGWETSVLGFPTTDELVTPNGQGRFNHFQHGSVYWSPASGAHAVYGAIRDRWGQAGWENSALGFPVTEEFPITGGRRQDFQYGSIRWSPSGGAVVVGASRAGGGRVPLGVTPPGTQVITVTAAPGATSATLTAWERRTDGWTAVLGPVKARVGSAGIGVASERSTRTPMGTWTLTEAFGRLADPGTALPYRVVDRDDWWVSDVASAMYNRYAQCAPGRCPFNEAAGENLGAAGAVYDSAVVIDYNRAGVRGAGSAFFLHISNGAATAGCVAVDRASLLKLVRWLKPAGKPVISIGLG